MIELFQDMGGRVLPKSKSGKFRGTFTSVLASALLEWLLILMLIIYAFFGYLITRFARYCDLPVPCLLCSRIDNLLGGEKAGFYWDMICGNHKLELSSLVYCHFHEKLVDVRGMCETCLFSFATKDKSNAETYRLLVGKLGEEDLSGVDDETFLDDNLTSKLKHCCCCNELWNPRRQTLLQAKSSGVDAPLSREASRDFDISEKDAVKTQASSTIIHVREMSEDPSVHFGYTDLKITSDSESDILASDIQDHLEDDGKKTHASSTIVHVREKTEDPLVDFGFAELKITSDKESGIHTFDNHDSFDKVGIKIQTSSTIHVIENMEDPLVDLGFTELKITSDSESDIHDTLEEEKKTQAPSTIIHVRENTEDHFEFTDLKTASDCESDIQVSDVYDSLEDEKRAQTSSKIFHVGEKTEDLLGYTDLKITSDNESDLQVSYIHNSLVESKNTQKSSTIIHVREKTEDHLGYTDLKMTSDDESDIQESDVEDARELISDDPFRNIILESTQVGPFISMSEDAMSPEHSQMSCELAGSDIIQAQDSPLIVSPPAIGHGLEELNWQTIDHKPNLLASTELINVNDDRSDPLVSMETIDGELLSDTQNGGSVPSDLSKVETNGATFQTKVLVTDKNQELETLQTVKNLNSSDTRFEHTDGRDGDVQMTNYLELSDAYKLAVSSRGRQSSEKLTEQLTGKNSSNTNLDLKILLSQFSRGLNLPSTGILSPRVSRNLDDLKTIKLLQKRASLERNDSRSSLDRNESGVESLDFCSVVEIEGETELDRLKRQLEHDKRFLIALLKELEEERNASASATNEAMAMITRLQEEKAALQMEASQELRMMEEQAEYDIDALDKLNELVTEKEKEIQNLEEELDYYRCKYPNDVGDPLSDTNRDEKEKCPHNDSWVITQDEREYLSECLRNLEKKLFHLGTHGENSSELISNNLDPELKIERKEDVVISSQSFEQSKSIRMHKEVETNNIVNEVSRLNERLQVLEADCSFIEHAINALSDGHEEVIQEIASHLRELHKAGIIRTYQTCFQEETSK